MNYLSRGSTSAWLETCAKRCFQQTLGDRKINNMGMQVHLNGSLHAKRKGCLALTMRPRLTAAEPRLRRSLTPFLMSHGVSQEPHLSTTWCLNMMAFTWCTQNMSTNTWSNTDLSASAAP